MKQLVNPSVLRRDDPDYPECLENISYPPAQLYYYGDLPRLLEYPRLGVIGSRRVSPYGRAVTEQLAHQAAEQGIVIISGLALGVDSLAHRAAVETAGGLTIAVLPAGLDRIYPSSHTQLAEQILAHGGAIVSEYPFNTNPIKPNFIARNRIVSALSDGILITEAATKSGTMHTANFALDQGKAVMVVPGNITSELSSGTNNLIKAGAAPVTELADIIDALGLDAAYIHQLSTAQPQNDQEAAILTLLRQGITDGATLLVMSKLTPVIFNQTLTMLEIQGTIRPIGAGHWRL